MWGQNAVFARFNLFTLDVITAASKNVRGGNIAEFTG
jgi:hypothetical protein